MRYFLIALVLMVWLPLLTDIRKDVEGHFFPVVGELEITNTQEGYRLTRVVGTAHKYRNCGHKKTVWYLGKRGNLRDPVVIIHKDKPQVRQAGVLYWDNIEVHLRESDVLTNSHANVIHECSFLGFKRDVVSRFYTSPTP